jgi:23S rRNA pseudouridine2605 synthase
VTVPLERALSKLGVATRAEARALITSRRVRVDGRTVADPLQPVVPERIAVTIDGRAVVAPARITIVLHKPRGVVTTRRDPEGRKTVYDLIADFRHHVVPVGRLDYATTGVLLLTNDTRLADWLADPANEVPRVYLVTARGRVTDEDAAALEHGVTSHGESLSARSVKVRKASNRESHLIVELIEGKNREVRRLLSSIGHEVTRLRRVQFGGIALDDLAPGAWRIVDARELRRAFPRAFRE